MDTLITGFVHQIKAKTNDETDKAYEQQMNTDNGEYTNQIIQCK